MTTIYFIEARFGAAPIRHKVIRHRGFEGYWSRCTAPCSRCTPEGAMGFGSGCAQCDHTGKRYERCFIPLDLQAWDRWHDRVQIRYQRLRAFWQRSTR